MPSGPCVPALSGPDVPVLSGLDVAVLNGPDVPVLSGSGAYAQQPQRPCAQRRRTCVRVRTCVSTVKEGAGTICARGGPGNERLLTHTEMSSIYIYISIADGMPTGVCTD